MGARPVAAMNRAALRSPDHPKTRHLVSGVVAGVGGYGNSFGVPTVGGDSRVRRALQWQHPRQCLRCGTRQDRRDLLLEGGRASASRSSISAPRPDRTVSAARRWHRRVRRVDRGEAPDRSGWRSLHREVPPRSLPGNCADRCGHCDPGHGAAAGLTCSAVEMGAKGDLGIELDLDKVPVREERMTAYEMMLSESQERMLMCCARKRRGSQGIFVKWGIDFPYRRQDHRRPALPYSAPGRRSREPADQGTRRRGAGIRPPLDAGKDTSPLATHDIPQLMCPMRF